MNTASNLACGKQSGNGLPISTEDAGLGVDLETTHGVVENRGHEGNVEDVFHPPFSRLEELFAERALLGPYDIVVIPEGLLELSRANSHVLGECSTIFVAFHEATTNVMFTMPLDLLGGFTVEDQSDRVLNA